MDGTATPDGAVLEGWLDALFATSRTAMSVISTFEGRYVRANAAMAELVGLSLEELYRCDPFALGLRVTHPDELAVEQALFAELSVGARRSYELDKRFVRPDGSIRWGRLTFSAIFAEPDAAGVRPMRYVVLHIADISEQKALAEALARRDEELRHAQKLDGLGRLAAGIAHDFNNLLTVIVGHGSVVRDRLAASSPAAQTPENLEDLDAILAASDRAASLTAQLLAHGRRETVAPRAFALSDAVEPLVRLFTRTIGSNIQVAPALAATGAIFADPGQVGQIVMNLMLNARDAMPDGGRIVLETRDVSEGDADAPAPGAWVKLVVADGGHGMSPEVQARMFEPFFTTRGDRPGTRGTGLGLATVRRIVTELGGHIVVRSAPGAGTHLAIFFPRTTKAPRADPRPSLRPSGTAARGQRVLVVEDEPAVRSLVASVLLGARYDVHVARNGEEALAMLNAAARPFDLVVTDLMMPVVGGTRLATLLEERSPRPRVLFISGYANVTLSELASLGRLLPKPFTPAQLVNAVALALGDASPGA